MRTAICVPACLCALVCALSGPSRAQGAPPAAAPAPGAEEASSPSLRFGIEVKAAYRNSADNRFKVPFAFPQLPPGVTIFERTVSPGSNLEIPAVTLFADAVWGEALAGHVKLDVIDLYYRNPTSTGRNIDVHEAWLRLGRESAPGRLPEHGGIYVKVGKFAKFERQNDRHLESYGLVSTAFNKTEDIGVEAGADLGRHFFLKGSYTRGNPLFMRDPNALAGDNGTPASVANPPHPPLNSGFPILYDAETQDLNGGGHEQTGAAAGVRGSNEDGSRRFELLAFGRRRTLAPRVEIFGTIYGGDLRVIDNADFGPFPGEHGNLKTETGGNLWLYWGGLTLFGQYERQDLAGLVRRAYEGELAWRIELPLLWSLAGRQLFPAIAPAVRYSKLDPQFYNPPTGTPAPSFAWEWEKVDTGIRLGIVPGTDLTVEHARNRFLTKAGWRRNDEFLTVLRWRM